jgi:hypothetical protein
MHIIFGGALNYGKYGNPVMNEVLMENYFEMMFNVYGDRECSLVCFNSIPSFWI